MRETCHRFRFGSDAAFYTNLEQIIARDRRRLRREAPFRLAGAWSGRWIRIGIGPPRAAVLAATSPQRRVTGAAAPGMGGTSLREDPPSDPRKVAQSKKILFQNNRIRMASNAAEPPITAP